MKDTQNRLAFLCDISKSGNAANFTVNAFERKARWENKLKEFLNCDVVAELGVRVTVVSLESHFL